MFLMTSLQTMCKTNKKTIKNDPFVTIMTRKINNDKRKHSDKMKDLRILFYIPNN